MIAVTCPRCFAVYSLDGAVNYDYGHCIYCGFDLGRYYKALLKVKEVCHECLTLQ
jgi:hypothetical protein